MGGWFSKPKCNYGSGWNKNNACPPGFTTVESCGRWSSSISCRAPTSGFDSRAIVAGTGRIVAGSCTGSKSATNPSQPSCPSGFTKTSSRNAACCDKWAITCNDANAEGWKAMVTCTSSDGDKVFQTDGAYSCEDKHNGVGSNDFRAQSWCKDANRNNCWLPYSMDADGNCFPYNFAQSKMQWDTPSGYDAMSKRGGSEILLQGGSPSTMSATSGAAAPVDVVYNSGSIAGVASGGFACVVGVGALLRKKQKKRSLPGNAADIELKDGANTV